MLTLFAVAALAGRPGSTPWPTVPLRLETRLIARAGMEPSTVMEGGFQVFRVRHLTTELNLGVVAATAFRDSSVARKMGTVSASADVLLEPTVFLGVGPTLSLDARWFRQQGVDVGARLVPTAGVRVNLDLLRGSWWALAFTLRGTSDLARIALVYGDEPARPLSMFSLQSGIRFDFGHGRNLRQRA